MGREKSWGYQQEQKRKLTGGQPSAVAVRDAGEIPSWAEAVKLILAIEDHHYDAPGPSLTDRYAPETVALAWVAAYLAGVQARATQDYLLEIHEDEEWWDEVCDREERGARTRPG